MNVTIRTYYYVRTIMIQVITSLYKVIKVNYMFISSFTISTKLIAEAHVFLSKHISSLLENLGRKMSCRDVWQLCYPA